MNTNMDIQIEICGHYKLTDVSMDEVSIFMCLCIMQNQRAPRPFQLIGIGVFFIFLRGNTHF